MRVLTALFAATLALAPLKLAPMTLAPMTAMAAQQAEPGHNVGYYDSDDAAMNRAEADAKKSLPQFWARYDSDAVVREYAVLKVGFSSKDGREEFMWVQVLSRKGGVITGILANTPVLDVGVKAGDTVTFDEKRVTDWGYRRDGVRWGFFSGRVMLARLPADQKAEANAGANFSPTPIEP